MASLSLLLALLSITATAFGANTNCPSNIHRETNNPVEFNGYCYELVLHRPADWYHARDDCRAKGGWLTDIHSFAEQGHIYNAIKIYGVPNDDGIWIGLSDEENENTWTWVSGAPVDFVNWASNQPGMVGGLEDCAVMEYSKHGLWHDYPCKGVLFTKEHHGWVCKYALQH